MAAFSNERQNQILPNYQFYVYVKNSKLRFSKVSNIERETELEEFAVGGSNQSPHIAGAPVKRGGRLILEQGVILKDTDTKNWKAGYYLKGPIDIFVYNRANQADFSKHYSINWGIIAKWELNSLDAMGSEILIQKFEIAHNGLIIG